MGQYYIIVNLDRKEYIDPSDFGDGCKLLEFGGSSDGVMQALAILTASGNGRGGGDICRTLRYEDGEAEPEGWELRPWERMVNECTSKGWTSEDGTTSPDTYYRTMAPSIAGSWEGNRIVTAGDYMDVDKYITFQEQLQGLHDMFPRMLEYENEMRERDGKPLLTDVEFVAKVPYRSYSLYEHAYANYENVSGHTKYALAQYGEGRCTIYNFNEVLEDFLSRRLRAEFPHKVTVGRGRNQRQQWDLSWLSAEMLDSLMRRWWDPEDVKRLKVWLRKQQLLPWQREALKCYLGRRNGDEVIKGDMLNRILGEAGLLDHPNGRLAQASRILPGPQTLSAALSIDNRSDDDLPITTDDPVMVERVAHEAGVPVRHRVIDLDGDQDATPQ